MNKAMASRRLEPNYFELFPKLLFEFKHSILGYAGPLAICLFMFKKKFLTDATSPPPVTSKSTDMAVTSD